MLPGDNERLRTWHDRFTELGIDSPLSHPLCFKKELHIGKTAYRSLKIKKRVFELLRPIGAAGVGATVASSSAVATTFFPAGILGALGLATAATPVGWVIGTAVFSGAAWAVITKKLDSLSSSRVVEIPKFINTPLDLLAVSIFDLVCSLAVKLAAIDGEFHERERIRITRYLVETWGYDERFVTLAMDMVNESDLGFSELLTNLVEFTRSNRDCNAPAISQNVLAFLHEVAEASDGIRECERHALLNAERAFTPDRGKFRTSVAKAKRRLLFRRSTSAPPKPAAPRSSLRRTPAATAVRSGANRAAKGFAAAKDAAAGGLTAARVTGGDALKGVADKGSALLRSGVAGAEAGLAATSAAAGSRLHSGAEAAGVVVRSGASGVAAGFSTAHGALAGFAENLDWSTIDPTQYLYAGTRGVSRGLEEARLVWESIPERLRALGPEEVGKRLEGFDWSHIRPHSQGGSNEASNGIFELASLNRSRGAERMSAAEVQAAQQVLSEQAFRAALAEAAFQVFTGVVAAAAVACVLSALELGLEYQRGEITKDEMYQRIGRAVATSAAVGGAVAGVMAVVALVFPALIPLAAPLMIPLAVLGLCAVGGKVVHLGKGWYELYQAVRTRHPSGVSPAELLPAPGAAASE